MITHTEALGGLLALIITACVSTGWILAAIHYRSDQEDGWEDGELERLPHVPAYEPDTLTRSVTALSRADEAHAATLAALPGDWLTAINERISA